jgi:hypothetical protein
VWSDAVIECRESELQRVFGRRNSNACCGSHGNEIGVEWREMGSTGDVKKDTVTDTDFARRAARSHCR